MILWMHQLTQKQRHTETHIHTHVVSRISTTGYYRAAIFEPDSIIHLKPEKQEDRKERQYIQLEAWGITFFRIFAMVLQLRRHRHTQIQIWLPGFLEVAQNFKNVCINSHWHHRKQMKTTSPNLRRQPRSRKRVRLLLMISMKSLSRICRATKILKEREKWLSSDQLAVVLKIRVMKK